MDIRWIGFNNYPYSWYFDLHITKLHYWLNMILLWNSHAHTKRCKCSFYSIIKYNFEVFPNKSMLVYIVLFRPSTYNCSWNDGRLCFGILDICTVLKATLLCKYRWYVRHQWLLIVIYCFSYIYCLSIHFSDVKCQLINFAWSFMSMILCLSLFGIINNRDFCIRVLL